ncbi:MAG: LysR family transcriptional regulator [OCS116 cluster bacterium]|uniref:HTH lysR-type domain-containing protein n=1 Tax=OCS116 cluster bacterium TaxID=2030921 RepID=A0A2A4YRR1_9PROT|nr:LysR family transcriptional regulator [OCS116 cluster bacterium]
MKNLDIAILRSFVAAANYGSIALASEYVNRTQGAVSMQIGKLEAMVGKKLFYRGKSGVSLTEAGQNMIIYARKILSINDEAISATESSDLEGVLKLGIPQDLGIKYMPELLGQYKRAFPNIRIIIYVDSNYNLSRRVRESELDIAILLSVGNFENATFISKLATKWIGPADYIFEPDMPLSLLLPPTPCHYFEMAQNGLKERNINCQVDFVSGNMLSIWAAVEAGLGLTIRNSLNTPPQLQTLDHIKELPPLADSTIWMLESTNNDHKIRQQFIDFLCPKLTQMLSVHV